MHMGHLRVACQETISKACGAYKATCAIALGALALGACDTTAGQSRRPVGQRQAIAIETTTPQRISVERQVELSGTVLSPDQAKVSSEVGGIVREVPVQLGTEVRP